jgi:hypothetical protein
MWLIEVVGIIGRGFIFVLGLPVWALAHFAGCFWFHLAESFKSGVLITRDEYRAVSAPESKPATDR